MLIVAGKIGAAHGIKGWVKVFSYTQPIENLMDYQPWVIEIRGKRQQLEIIHSQVHGDALLISFAGINDRDQAATLTNGLIYIDRSQLPPLKEGEYYWIDLEGLEVKNLDGFVFGKIDYLMNTGANDVMFIKGEKEYCLPYVPKVVVKNVDLANKQMLVDWPAELE